MYLCFIVQGNSNLSVMQFKPNRYMFKCILALAESMSNVWSKSKAWDQISSKKGLKF